MNDTFRHRGFIKRVLPLLLLLCLLTACTQKQGPKQAGSSVSASVTTASVEASTASSTGPADETGPSATGASNGDTSSSITNATVNTSSAQDSDTVTENGEYQTKDEVALYIHLYGQLPSNYITKKEAEKLGWESSKGNLREVAPGKSIGGDKFGNREGLLPEAADRKYYECDIDYKGGGRNAKRIVYSNDGLIFYTDDHYASFEQLY